MTPVTTGLGYWFEADGISGVANGQAVTVWPDQSASPNNATVSAGSSVYQTNQVNGLPACTLVNCELLFGSAFTPYTSYEHTAFAVFQLNNPSARGVLIGGVNVGDMGWWFDTNQGVYYTRNPQLGVDGYTVGNGSATTDTNWHSAAMTLVGSFAGGGFGLPMLQLWYDGVVDTPQNTGLASFANASPISDIGNNGAFYAMYGNNYGGPHWFNGQVAALGYYSRLLSGFEVDEVNSYLDAKYNIVAARRRRRPRVSIVT